LVTDSYSILATLGNQLLNVHGVNCVKQTEIHTAEPLGPERLRLIWLKHTSPSTDQITAELINLYPTNTPRPFNVASYERNKKFKCPVRSCRGLEL